MTEEAQRRLTYWLEAWDEQLMEPSSILLNPTLLNLLDHVFQEVTNWLAAPSRGADINIAASNWTATVLRMLRDRLTGSDGREGSQVLALFRSAYRSRMRDLQSLLSQPE